MTYGFPGASRPVYYRSVFLSDFHMGAKSFDAKAVTDFLKSCTCDKLYLVGDIVDGWKLNKRWFWTEDCNRVIDELIRKADQGTRIIYLPGNHDEEIRRILPILKHRFAKKMRLEIREKIIHKMLDGRKMLVLHGDQFDRKIIKGPLSRWSDQLYDRLLDLLGTHRRGPKIRIGGKLKPFSLAKSLSRHGQWALQLMNNFENAVYRCVKDKGLDGLICGHTHIPVIKSIQDITYANSGCWLNHGHTALVETHDGQLELIDWESSFSPPLLSPALIQNNATLIPGATAFRPQTLQILYAIRKVWPVKRPLHTQKPAKNKGNTPYNYRSFAKMPIFSANWNTNGASRLHGYGIAILNTQALTTPIETILTQPTPNTVEILAKSATNAYAS